MNTSLSALEYDLPDSKILDSDLDFDFYIWQPDSTYIVLGRANNPEESVYMERAVDDKIKILKRNSGGHSVVLSPKMVVFSLKQRFDHLVKPGKIFDEINESLIASFKTAGVYNLAMNGISDLSINGKKVLGSSMYINNGKLFYHAVINVNEDAKLISRYLKHPSREPDYRNGRNHEEFVTSLYKEGHLLDIDGVMNVIANALINLKNEYTVNKTAHRPPSGVLLPPVEYTQFY
ncbi:MAG: hypothetical protein A2X18_14235 [Bacteroidetes bacterium GWF2_40_14]|nr:MAG: hypothetical protein A2X18_14235 [Bacteroidetes bacterium GWF2_40_14]